MPTEQTKVPPRKIRIDTATHGVGDTIGEYQVVTILAFDQREYDAAADILSEAMQTAMAEYPEATAYATRKNDVRMVTEFLLLKEVAHG